jgi:hypothetical protein
MATRYVLFWFDVEDCTVPQSDDAAKRIAQILTRHGVRGTMKVVGQKARVLRERVRYDAIDALAEHAIGYHSNWHGLRPQPAEYMAPLDWPEGGEEFARREEAGLGDLRDLWGREPVCYGQPGPNWSPQVFPILRRWGIPGYVSGYGYVGLHAQPFYYGGIVNTSHMHGRDGAGRDVRHMFGLNFELGEPGALEEHRRLLAASYDNLADGGLISIMNHPCTLVLREWFSTDLKPRELTEAGYEHFDAFVGHVLSHSDVRTVTADQLSLLYPDRARGRRFSPDELLALARAVGREVAFQETDGLSLSPAELFGLFARFLSHAIEHRASPDAVTCEHLDGPALPAGEVTGAYTVEADAFADSVTSVAAFLDSHGRLPEAPAVARRRVAPEAYYAALAEAVAHVIEHGSLPERIGLSPAANLVEAYVDEPAARSGWSSVMHRPGFAAPKLLEQARLQAWTLKPAILSGTLS